MGRRSEKGHLGGVRGRVESSERYRGERRDPGEMRAQVRGRGPRRVRRARASRRRKRFRTAAGPAGRPTSRRRTRLQWPTRRLRTTTTRRRPTRARRRSWRRRSSRRRTTGRSRSTRASRRTASCSREGAMRSVVSSLRAEGSREGGGQVAPEVGPWRRREARVEDDVAAFKVALERRGERRVGLNLLRGRAGQATAAVSSERKDGERGARRGEDARQRPRRA